MYCQECGISLEIDFNDEFGEVCAQCKMTSCCHSCIVYCHEDTNKVLYAVCMMNSDAWPKCGDCEFFISMND